MPLTPIAIKTYYALLTQTSTNAPQALVLHNTIGQITWTYQETGIYIATSENFNFQKTMITPTINIGGGSDLYIIITDIYDPDTWQQLQVNTYLNGAPANGLLTKLPIQITVFA